jgi:hypothetical protein
MGCKKSKINNISIEYVMNDFLDSYEQKSTNLDLQEIHDTAIHYYDILNNKEINLSQNERNIMNSLENIIENC